MKFGINNWVYADEPLEETFKRLAKYDYDAVELKGELSLYDIDEIKELCSKYGMCISSILPWLLDGLPGRDLSNPDQYDRQTAIAYCFDVIQFASKVGAPIVLMLPFPANRTSPIGNPPTPELWETAAKLEWNNAVKSVKEIAEYAKDFDITLAVEPINRYETYQLTTVDNVLRFINDVKMENVKINLDIFHMNIDEKDLPEAIRKAGSLLVHMHCADSNREAPGRGHTDFQDIIAALHDIEFSGTMVFEPVPPGADPGIAILQPENIPLRDIYAKESIEGIKEIERRFHE